ncbi:hypothetical protein [Tenacibaculum jejuense]|uniref:Probable lipoprotein n=1 Tax=Tenacibaculum jejuense TaxID=584609 RepID=A0A238UEP4_9FLAO|nr:hypothetical protein [Tenacibaculum jejuense]SNR17677.1 Probable lipoprotein precursor [Tenacibaculum jejuense]
MKKRNLILVFLIALSFYSCSKDDENITQQINEELQLTIEFADGPHKGKYTFKEIENKFDSDIGGDVFDGNSSFEFRNITTENNFVLNNFRRTLKGFVDTGKIESVEFTNGCGSLFFRDENNNFSYKEIRANFTGCSTTEVLEVSSWQKDLAYEKRKIKAEFDEDIVMKVINDDDSILEINTTIKVSFVAEQKRLI